MQKHAAIDSCSPRENDSNELSDQHSWAPNESLLVEGVVVG